MGHVLLLGAILASVILAIAIARVALSCALHLMHEGLPFTFHWRSVILTSALFWCWYLSPMIAESRAVTTVLRLVSSDAAHGLAGDPGGRPARSRQ